MYCRDMTGGRSGLFFRDKIFMLEWGFSIAFLSQQIVHTPAFNSFRLGKYAVIAKAGHIFLLVRNLYSINTQRWVKKVNDNRLRQSTAKNRHPRPNNQEQTTLTVTTDYQQQKNRHPRPDNQELKTPQTATPDNQQSALEKFRGNSRKSVRYYLFRENFRVNR